MGPIFSSLSEPTKNVISIILTKNIFLKSTNEKIRKSLRLFFLLNGIRINGDLNWKATFKSLNQICKEAQSALYAYIYILSTAVICCRVQLLPI